MPTPPLLSFLTALVALGGISAHAADQSVYEQFGARPGLEKIVDDATARWLNDVRIKLTFDNLYLPRFKGHLVDQFCELIGGPCTYKGRNMYDSHKGLNLGTAEFNALAEGLQDAMEAHGVPYSAQNKLMAKLAPMKRDIVTRSRFSGSPRVGDPPAVNEE